MTRLKIMARPGGTKINGVQRKLETLFLLDPMLPFFLYLFVIMLLLVLERLSRRILLSRELMPVILPGSWTDNLLHFNLTAFHSEHENTICKSKSTISIN